jgi:3-hydroxyisobutyrate dehydrogenase
LLVFDLKTEAVIDLCDAGAIAAQSVAEIAGQCQVIFLCLPTFAHVRETLLGKGGIASHAAPGTLIVDQTSGDPAETQAMATELEGHGLVLVDAPVSGGPRRAVAGTLAVMVGADPAAYARLHGILAPITSNIFHAGPVGAGNVAKLANNLLLAGQQVVTLEAVAFAARNGVPPEAMCDILMAGTGNNYYLANLLSTHIVKGKLRYTGALGTLQKDVSLACKLADSSGAALMLGGTVRALLQQAVNEFGPEVSVNALALTMERLVGAQIVPVPNDLDIEGGDSNG